MNYNGFCHDDNEMETRMTNPVSSYARSRNALLTFWGCLPENHRNDLLYELTTHHRIQQLERETDVLKSEDKCLSSEQKAENINPHPGEHTPSDK
jgi:hypothetical protein